MERLRVCLDSSTMPRAAASRPRLSHPRGARERALKTVELLREEYPLAATALEHRDPFQLLVATILSAQTTDERVNLTTPALFARFPDAPAIAEAPVPELEGLIHATGFFRSKSRALIEMSQDLVSRYGGEVPPRMEDLVTLRGVGRKTANVVLGVAFGVPGFPVDTHVTRLTNRLRLTKSTDPERIEAEVCDMVPREEWTNLSLRLILHGRRICVARKPLCERCVLAGFCPSAFKVPPPRKSAPARRKPAPAQR
jgi:endonuclease-3